MKKEKLAEIRSVVFDAISEAFDNVKIEDVQVRTDVDSDGDEVLRIDVIFIGKPKDLDAKQLSGAVRHLRPKLIEIDEPAFPLLSFISAAELERGRVGSH